MPWIKNALLVMIDLSYVLFSFMLVAVYLTVSEMIDDGVDIGVSQWELFFTTFAVAAVSAVAYNLLLEVVSGSEAEEEVKEVSSN